MRVFIGRDQRQPVAAQVAAYSISRHAKYPVQITFLDIDQLKRETGGRFDRQGLTQFTFARYLVPYLCNYEGEALFVDADILCRADVGNMSSHWGNEAVKVVQDGVERFEWPSVMLFNNAKCKVLTPDYIQNESPHKLEWGEVGELPKEWNHIVPYSGKNPDAKIIHYTQGIPCFEETKNCEWGEEWREEYRLSTGTVSWKEIMGPSVHASRMGLA